MGPGDGFRIDDTLAAFLELGNSVVVATRNKALDPHAVRACGVEVLGPTRVAVLVPTATGARVRADLEETGDIAIAICSPRDYRTVQLKGRCVAVTGAGPADIARSEDQLRGFAEAILPFGHTRQLARNAWLFDVWRVEVQVTAGYDQTPGLGAGSPLGAARAR
jgi:hypothetical protein